MKNTNRLFAISVFVVLLLCIPIVSHAVNTGFSTEYEKDLDAYDIAKKIKFSVMKNEPRKEPMDCFDVSESGMIAIGTSQASSNKRVYVYTSEGEYKYGYTFRSGGSFALEFDGEVLNIYFVRSDIILAVAPGGEIKGISKVQNTKENTSYLLNELYATEKEINGTKYIIRNDIGFLNLFATSYSRLVVKASDGEESIIYDVNAYQFVVVLFWVVGITAFVSIVITDVVRRERERRRRCFVNNSSV